MYIQPLARARPDFQIARSNSGFRSADAARPWPRNSWLSGLHTSRAPAASSIWRPQAGCGWTSARS